MMNLAFDSNFCDLIAQTTEILLVQAVIKFKKRFDTMVGSGDYE